MVLSRRAPDGSPIWEIALPLEQAYFNEVCEIGFDAAGNVHVAGSGVAGWYVAKIIP